MVITASLLTPLVPGAFSAGSPNAPVSPSRAATRAASFAVAPLISATKSDAFPDPDSDNRAVPGDTITYTVQITNNGTDATGVVFNDTVDANTTSNGTFTTTPVAIDDTYSAVGNVQINVPAASGLTSNDSDPDGGPITAVAGTTTSTNGGNVTVNADGSFSYNPPPGFEGADTFTYTINGASAPSNTSTVTVNVAGMIWFVNAAAAAGGDGRLTTPFNALTGPGSFDAVAADQSNDNIFLYSGPYMGGLTLLAGQALIGQGSTASLSAVTGLTPPSYSAPFPPTGGSNPVIGGASGISLATNNLIRGVTIQNTAGTGISGSGFGILAVADTAVNSTGPALDLNNGQLQTSFQSLASTSSATAGISLSNIAVGSLFSGGTTTINSRGTTGIDLDSVEGTIAFGATTIPNPGAAGGYGIRVRNSGAGVSFASATITDANQSIAQADANNDLIPETDGDGDAIFLSNNTGSIAINGGVLSNCGNDCVDARNSANVSLSNLAINFPGVDAVGLAGTGGSGIQAINLSGSNSLTNVNVQNFNVTGRDGMRLINNAAAAMTMVVSNSLFADSTTSSGNGIVISGRDNANMALTVNGNSTFQNLLGPAISHRGGDNAGSTATVNLTVQSSTFQNAPVGGQNTVHTSTTEGAKATVLIDGNTFNNVARTLADTSGVIDINGDATLAGNTLSVNITNNIIQNIGTSAACLAPTSLLPCTGRRGIDVFMDDNTNASGTVVIDGNQLSNIHRAGIILDTGSVFNGASYNAKITNNTVGTAAARVGLGTALSAGGENGVIVTNRNNNGKNLNLNLSGNTVRNANGGSGSTINTAGILIRDQNSATTDATVTGNDIETNTSNAVAELRVDTLTATSTLCLDVNGNTLAGGGAGGIININESAGTLNVEQASAAAITTANNGATVTTSGTPQFGVTCANPPLVLFRTNTNREYLATLSGPTTQATRGLAYLSMARPSVISEILPSLDTWRSNWKQALGGLSYRNAVGSTNLNSYLRDMAVRPAPEAAPAALAYAAAPMPFSGETINVNVGTLPAGKSMTITFQATIDIPFNSTQVSNQGTVTGTNFSPVVTDDPDTGAFGDPTVTLVGSPPTISCPADIITNTDPGQFSASVAFSVTATGTPAPTVDCKIGATSITSPHTFPVGTTAVQCTATNGVGSPASCSFNVTVNDNQTPTISCPANITTTTAPDSCEANVSVGTPTVNDNDPGVTVNGVRSDSQPLNAPYPKGTTTITWTATDTAGNSASCQQTVTVNDATAPVITLNGSADMTVECHTSFSDPGATANDSCDGLRPVSVSGSVNVNVPGDYTLTYSATDTSGNTGSTTRVVHVVDTTAPVITVNGPNPMTVECHTTFTDPGATATDSCDTSVPVTTSGSVNTNVPGTYTLTYNASDDSGNAATPKTRTVIVVDTTPPSISCQADVFVNYDPAVGGAVVNYTTPVGTDSCSGALVATRTTGLASGSVFPLGTTTNTFVVTDGAGLTASCSFKVTVGLTSIVGLNSVSISGSSYADSYDSSLGYPASKGSQADIVSNGTITLAGSGKVWGNVRSTQAGVNMSGASQVTGNATAATTVSKSGSASVGGTTTNNSPATPVALPPVPACGPPYSSNAGISGTYSYNSSTGDLNLSGINIATLANGTYCFHNVTLSNSAELKVNGPVVIKITGTLNVGGATKVNNTTTIPGNLRILSSYSGSNGVNFTNGGSSYLVMYAPQTGVTISGAGPVFGTVAGKTITLSNSGALHYDTKLASIWFDLWMLL